MLTFCWKDVPNHVTHNLKKTLQCMFGFSLFPFFGGVFFCWWWFFGGFFFSYGSTIVAKILELGFCFFGERGWFSVSINTWIWILCCLICLHGLCYIFFLKNVWCMWNVSHAVLISYFMCLWLRICKQPKVISHCFVYCS